MKSLFKKYGSQQPQNPLQNVTNVMQQFQQFASTFQGNPQQQVENLLNSGKMPQNTFQQCAQWANFFMKMMGK